MPDRLDPDPALEESLRRLLSAPTRRRMGSIGLLGSLEPVREGLNRYEAQLVAQARDEHSSWEEIGGALGVPRQTAHRRHGGEDR